MRQVPAQRARGMPLPGGGPISTHAMIGVVPTDRVPTLPRANTGFDGRVHLTKAEHQTYLRRMPVRYSRAQFIAAVGPPVVCVACGEPSADGNPLQACHRVPFGEGVRRWRLTPDWLDRPDNLCWAHQKVCNKKVELSPAEVADLLEELGNLSARTNSRSDVRVSVQVPSEHPSK